MHMVKRDTLPPHIMCSFTFYVSRISLSQCQPHEIPLNFVDLSLVCVRSQRPFAIRINVIKPAVRIFNFTGSYGKEAFLDRLGDGATGS